MSLRLYCFSLFSHGTLIKLSWKGLFCTDGACFVSQQQFWNNLSFSSTNYNCLSFSLMSILPFGRLNIVLRLYKYRRILKWYSLWCYFLFIRPSAVQMKLAERRGILSKIGIRQQYNEYVIAWTSVADSEEKAGFN